VRLARCPASRRRSRELSIPNGPDTSAFLTRDRDACTTIEIENPTAAGGWQTVDEATDPFLTNRRNAEPFEIDVCYFV
jgi:hypothetical protein